MTNVFHIGKLKAIFLYILVSIFLIFEMAVQVSPSVITSQLMHDLNLSTFGLGMMSGFYFYTYTIMQLPSGILFDRFNPRFIITISILICSIGALSFGVSRNIYMGCFSRLLLGTGSAFAFVSVLVVISDLFDKKYFALLAGITQMLAAFGAMTGQIPLGKLVSLVGWRHAMFMFSFIGFILSSLVYFFINYKKEIPHKTNKADFNLLNGLKDIFSNNQTWIVAIYAALLWAPMVGFASLWGVPYLIKVCHLNSSDAACVCSLMWLGLAFLSPLLGFISTAIGRRVLPLVIVSVLGGVAFCSIIVFNNMPIWLLGSMLFISGAACSGQVLSFSVVKENNKISQRTTAIAFNNMAVVISGAVFQPLIGKFLQFYSGNNNIVFSFKLSLSVILLSYFIGAIIALFFIRETYCSG